MAPKSVPVSTLVGPESEVPYLFHIHGSVFISAFDEASNQGWACHYSEAQVRARDFHATLRRLVPQASPRQVKVIGPRVLLDALAPALAQDKIKPVTWLARETAAEILFYARTGRVRLERETAATAAPVTVTPAARIRVMIVDDSQTIRNLLERILSADAAFEIVASIGDPLQVEAQVAKLKPDVITMDIHMPGMDGVTLTKRLMERKATPIVMVTSVSMEEGPAVLDALEHGAVDYIQKPSFTEIDGMKAVLVDKIKAAARAKVSLRRARAKTSSVYASRLDLDTIVGIGSSTGGTEALKDVLTRLPKEIPPIVIVQHIPAVFSRAFAERMATLCPFAVKEAEDGDVIRPGHVFIAPGGRQMELTGRAGKYSLVVHDGPAVNRHKPSVDVLFNSIAAHVKGPKIGVILTGMGGDGARGLLAMRKAGARTIGQSEQTCVVYGMPREAALLGAVESVVDLDKIPEKLVHWLGKKGKAA